MEPPTNLPRRATTLTRLWRSTDAADSIAQFLPTEALSALPKIAKSFERDHWRLLGALMRRAKRGTAAACKSAVLSTLQMCGHDNTLHLREDWADQARFSENWTRVFTAVAEGPNLWTTRQRSPRHTSNGLRPKF